MELSEGPQADDADEEPGPRVTALECSPERTVFTEDGNDDAWISTDTTVSPDP